MSEEQLIQTPGVFGETGNFLLERELGRGGMGGVYMGRDKMLDRPVAVKVMLREYGTDKEFVEKFKKEAQASARLIHPNIAQVYSYGIADGMPYIAMELVAGGSLDGLMKVQGATIEVPRVMKICEQVAQALRCAADQGLVHGDVKPENVLLDANGNAKLVDFGLAAMQKDTDEIWGTPYYIAPEKVRKQPVDYRADMYSLGGTIYHALTGVAPFEGEDATEVVKKRFMGMPLKPSEVRPGISPQIDQLVMTMLAVDPAERYPSWEALLADYKKVMAVGLGFTQPIPEGAGATGKTGRKKMVLSTRRSPKPNLAETVEGGDPSKLKKGKDGYVEETPEGDNVGGKVALFIGIIVLVIAVVAGGLYYIMGAKERGKDEEYEKSVAANIQTARDSLENTRKVTLEFGEAVFNMATAAENECMGPTEELRKVMAGNYPDAVIAMLKPALSKELLAAIASTNAPEGAASAPAAAAAAPAATAATEAAKSAEPEQEGIDPASPEGEAAAAAAAAAATAQGGAAGSSAGEGGEGDVPAVVSAVNDLWNRAYAGRAAEINIHVMVRSLVKKIDAFLQNSGQDEATMDALVKAAENCKTEYESIKASKFYETISKTRLTIVDRGKRAVNQEISRLDAKKKREAREAAAAAAAAAESNRLAQAAAEKAQRIAEEIALAKETFEKVNANLVQLDWKSAKRTLSYKTDSFQTAEGQLEAERQMRKVEIMESVTAIFIKNLKGYTFQKKGGKKSLAGCTVTDVDEKGFTCSRSNTSKSQTVSWHSFYRDYHNNLNELINRFIKNGRKYCEPKLNLSQWADAMFGVALTMEIVCSDDPTAAAYGKQLTKEVVKQFPNKLPQAKEFFPSLDFSDVAAEVEANQL